MKRLFASTALVAMLAAPAMADTHSEKYFTETSAKQILGSEFIGARVYVVENEIDDNFNYEQDAEKEWDDIGEINNIVMTRDGDIKAVIIGVGGFLGLGEKDVAVKMDSIKVVSDGDDANDYFLVFTSTKEELEAAPEWDRAEYRQAQREAQETANETKRAMAVDTMSAAERTKMMERRMAAKDMDLDAPEAKSAYMRDGYKMVEADKMSASVLIGANVYDINNDDVGEIDDLIVGGNGDVSKAVIDVGGFLGMGEKAVSMNMEDLRIMRSDDGDDIRVYTGKSFNTLEEMPKYTK